MNSCWIVNGSPTSSCCATMPYRISGTDGTSSSPRLPDDVTSPKLKRCP